MMNDEQKELEFYAEWSEIEPYLEKMTETELQKLLVFINLTGKAKIVQSSTLRCSRCCLFFSKIRSRPSRAFSNSARI